MSRFLLQFLHFFFSVEKENCHKINIHWRPYYLLCPFCYLDFDQFIGRVESFEEDVMYVIIKANLTEKIPLDDAGLRKKTFTTSRTISDEKLNKEGLIIASNRTFEYFRPLEKTLIKDLYRLYKFDFDMFEYSIKECL